MRAKSGDVRVKGGGGAKVVCERGEESAGGQGGVVTGVYGGQDCKG